MARYDGGWCQLPRESLNFTRGDPILKSLFSTLCMWANVEDSMAPNGKSLILVRKGEVKTTAMELSVEIGCDHKTIPRKLKLLAIYGLVCVASVYRGVIVNVVHLSQSDGSTNPSYSRVTKEFCIAPVPRHELQMGVDLGSAVPCIEERERERERERGGGERARELAGIPPPPILKSLNQKEIGNGHAQPEAGLLVSVEVNELGASWLWWALESAPSGKFELSEFNTAIIRIQEIRKCNTAEIRQLFEFIKTDSKLSGIFISPCWHDKKWGGGITLLDDAWIKAFPKRKEDSKKEISAEEMVERIRLKRLKASHGG